MLILDVAFSGILFIGAIYVLGCIALAALPIWIAIELIRWSKNKK